jgi:type II secretory pathway pseudopilin PulG
MKNKIGQVWIETVIYTLIGLVLIGTLLAFATPAIEKQKDKTILQNTIYAMNQIDNNILEVKRNGIANTRQVDFSVGKGNLIVDGISDIIIFQIDDSSYAYSQIGYDQKIAGSNQKVLTEKKGNKYKITLKLDYKDKLNLTYNKLDQNKTFTVSPTSYALVIENNGKTNFTDPASLTNINIYQSS